MNRPYRIIYIAKVSTRKSPCNVIHRHRDVMCSNGSTELGPILLVDLTETVTIILTFEGLGSAFIIPVKFTVFINTMLTFGGGGGTVTLRYV